MFSYLNEITKVTVLGIIQLQFLTILLANDHFVLFFSFIKLNVKSEKTLKKLRKGSLM